MTTIQAIRLIIFAAPIIYLIIKRVKADIEAVMEEDGEQYFDDEYDELALTDLYND